MGFFKFSCVLTRKITEGEFATLQEEGCVGGTLSTYMLPVSDNTVVTQIDFDKAEAETLYDAMQTVFDALTKVPNLGAYSLDVPEESADRAPEGSQIEPELVSDTSTPVTAEVEAAANDMAQVEAAANDMAEVEAVAKANLESANDNGAANGTTITADDAAATVEPRFAGDQMA
jgi:hypothetical protein